MSLFKKLFSTNADKQHNPPVDFSEGDLFYTMALNQYQVYKLLVHDKDFACYHVLSYKPLDALPVSESLHELQVAVYHLPIEKNGFKDAKFLQKDNILSGDLIGYHEYLRQTQPPDYYIPIANEYYQTGLVLTDENKHYDAIDAYSKAIDLMPEFFEAIDNRAFCYMDLAHWDEAIKGFQESLSVNPQSLLAEFSIGECYLNLHNHQKAKQHFEQAIAIDPTHDAPRLFLQKVNTLIDAS